MAKVSWAGNFAKLLLGSSAGQALALLIYPLIAQRYGPAEFAAFGLVASLSIVLSHLGTAQFHTAILRPRDDREAAGLVGSSVATLSVVALLVMPFSLARGEAFTLMAPYVLLYGLFEALKSMQLRNREQGRMAATVFGFRFGGNALKLPAVFANLGATGLVASEVLALTATLAANARTFVRGCHFDRAIWRAWAPFALTQTGSVLLLLAIADFPVLMWTGRFAAVEIGAFVMGQKLILVPVIIIGVAVYNAAIHSLLDATPRRGRYLQLLAGLGFAGAGIVVAGRLLVGPFSQLILGDQWVSATPVFTVLVLGCLTKPALALAQGVFIQSKNAWRPLIIRGLQLAGCALIPHREFLDALTAYVLIDVACDILVIAWSVTRVDQVRDEHPAAT